MQQNVFQFDFIEVFSSFATEVRETDFRDVILATQQAELQLGFITGCAVALLQVPFTFFTPAETA